MKNNKWIVYCHTCPNGKRYFGITSYSPNIRWRNGQGYKNAPFYNAINKYGWDNIKHEVLFENLTKEDAEQKEVELIRRHASITDIRKWLQLCNWWRSQLWVQNV